jgi:hypothetical protein
VISPSTIDERTASIGKASCDGQYLELPDWGDEKELVVQGVDIHHPPGFSIHPMDTRWSRETATGTPFPLDRMLAVRGFSLSSGLRQSRHTQEGYLEKFTGSVRYVFTPLR